MKTPQKPAGAQPANLQIGIPIKPASATLALNIHIEFERLRKTIKLAEEAIKIACDHRSAGNADGETIEETRQRWFEANEIESAAQFCRKAARSALAGLKVFPDLWSAEKVTEKIEEARKAALALKAACDAGQEADQRRKVDIAARNPRLK